MFSEIKDLGPQTYLLVRVANSSMENSWRSAGQCLKRKELGEGKKFSRDVIS